MNVYHDACHTYEVGHSIECINIKVHLTEIIGKIVSVITRTRKYYFSVKN